MEPREQVESVIPEGNSGNGNSFDDKVSAVVSSMKKDEKGHWLLPESDIPEEVKYAANAERRRRDTESALSKTRLQLKAQESVSEELKKRVAGSQTLNIDESTKSELDDLMYSDPQKWRMKMNELENAATATLQTELGQLTAEASQQIELAERSRRLDEYNSQNPNAQITDDVIKFDIPPRITNRLSNGEVSFADFLTEANRYLTAPKVIGGSKTPDIPDLSNVGGGSVPSVASQNADTSSTYKNTIF